ncbi:MAG: SIR2 family NAD-dependent protein deacylase [Aliihoeflea sp.]|uniref:SIR2 family NAD-dependent protein deacylase n=1 Tax=Aliihoeflea sp. TaxID=2608088 RepID=UPI0040338361
MSEDALEEAINDISGGSAICFVGAGFSWGATDAQGKLVPSVADLCAEICEFPGLQNEKTAQLTDLAEFCNDDPVLKQRLVIHLINRLTACIPSDAHYRVMNMPWRAVFTTNFDDVAERALKGHGPLVVTPVFDVRNLRSDRRPLYYLHGRASDFLDGVDDPQIVLSESNYLEIRNQNRNLYSAFENEIHCASTIVFIGYSLRDAEIATRLFAIDGMREKSVVICGSSETMVTLSRLKKFGTPYPIGVDGFAARLPDAKNISALRRDEKNLNFVNRREPVAAKSEVESSDVDGLLLSGDFDYSAFANQQRQSNLTPEYCIVRSRHIEAIFNAKVNRFLVTSDLGNGKSVFLNQMIFEGHARGFEIFSIETQLPEIFAELDVLLASPSKRMFIIDSLVRFRKVVRYIGKRLPSTSMLVCASGQNFDEASYASIIDDMGGAYREIDLNGLDTAELANWDRLLERWGFWEGRIEESSVDRIRFLQTQCGAENRSIVLSLFRESRLSKKIDEIVSFFLTKSPQHSKAFIAILINSICQNHVDWLRIVDWLDIDNAELRTAVLSSPVGDFMSGRHSWYEFTSTELASYIFNNYDFEVDQIVEVYTKIVRETAYSANDPRGGYDARENLKELMRYRFLTRLFSRPALGDIAINAVYQRLSKVPRIRDNDQFWLQYAMARMEVDDLTSAETYLSTAIGLASKRGQEYSKNQIIDQQIRLVFMKNARSKSSVNKRELLTAAKNIETLIKDKSAPVVHPLRSAVHLLELLDSKADQLDKATVVSLKDTVMLMKDSVPEGRLDKSQKGETEAIRKNLRLCSLVLESL